EDDVVKVDGKRVALGEVEGCLGAFAKIKAAQATVVTDPMAGSMVVARVVTKQKCGAEEIIDPCARNLAPYKVPRRIEFVETMSLVDHDLLAGVVTAKASVEVVLRAAHRADARDDTGGLAGLRAAPRTRRVVDGVRDELVTVVRTAPQSRFVC